MKKIETLHLFPLLGEELITLLRGLEDEQWLLESPIEGRTVKDLASHIIDGSLRKLALQRDGFADQSNIPDIKSYPDLIAHIQQLNADWMNVTRRLSPRMLLDMLSYSQKEFHDFLQTLDPMGEAIFPVSWAGEDRSQNWFDIAREFTEVWHHQMQIRLAVGAPILMDTKYTEPLYDTFMRALPYHYSEMKDYETGYCFEVYIRGRLNKSWTIEKQVEGWQLLEGEVDSANSTVEIADDLAWKLFTNTDREKDKYRSSVKVKGDEKLAYHLLTLVTVMS